VRTYQLILQKPNIGEVDRASIEGENAFDAFEKAVDAKMLNIPYGFIGRVVAIRIDSICLVIEVGFAG